jgi:DNA-binding transcriptional regulator GbsR (MarR family)
MQSWKLVRMVHVMGDRRDHFETSSDIWELFRTIVRERKQRELDPTADTLKQYVKEADFARESQTTQHRIKEALAFMQTLTGWTDEMIRLGPDTFERTGGSQLLR